MAKSSTSTRSGGTSRIRFIMLDAEIAEGDLSQVTQAIQNALRPTPGAPRVIAAPPALSSGAQASHGDDALPILDEQDTEDSIEAPAPQTGRSERAAKPRKYPSPEVIELDLKSDPSFASFIEKKKIDSDTDRYLAVAAWFKECRQIDEIGPNHVYTCYRAVHWPCNIKDFAQPLRALKFRDFMTTPSRGLYAINHIGLDRVAELNNG